MFRERELIQVIDGSSPPTGATATAIGLGATTGVITPLTPATDPTDTGGRDISNGVVMATAGKGTALEDCTDL